jgi:hypothetical protein
MNHDQGEGDTVVISREDMIEHINASRAFQWTEPVGGFLPTVVEFGGTWYVVMQGEDVYRPAPPEIAEIFTAAKEDLRSAAEAVAAADARA